MMELTDWIQQNWLELGTLLAQAMIPIVLVWYGRKVVKTLEAHRQEEPAHSRLNTSGPLGLSGVERPVMTEEAFDAPGIATRVGSWLQQPMSNKRNSPSTWRRLARWLQAPAGS